jgi:hypothetical protein
MATVSEVQRWRREEAAVFEGWDFSYLKDRASQDEPPWSYRDLAANLIRAARHPLDVDTGGGEFLASLAPLPPATKANRGLSSVALSSNISRSDARAFYTALGYQLEATSHLLRKNLRRNVVPKA